MLTFINVTVIFNSLVSHNFTYLIIHRKELIINDVTGYNSDSLLSMDKKTVEIKCNRCGFIHKVDMEEELTDKQYIVTTCFKCDPINGRHNFTNLFSKTKLN